MKLKKIVALLLACVMLFALAACGDSGGKDSPSPSQSDKPSESPKPSESEKPSEAPSESQPAGDAEASSIELWVYPVGGWGKEENVKPIVDAFKAETGIDLKVEYLAYGDGDDKVNTALTGSGAPDLIMEGPERLVANWGAKGRMVDLSDMLDDTDKSEILAPALTPCINAEGKMYEYPMCMTAHCMAINKQAFEEAGALQYVDLENHTWTTENFIKAVEALYAKYGETVGAVFCKGQGGDQGTRALVNNLYGGTFTNAEHTQYTWEDPNNVKALEQLKGMDGIAFDASLEGGDEIKLFYQGVLKMAFCWNIAQQLNPNQANTGEGKTLTGDDIVFMSFPSETGESQLCGGVWGFGIFDNGDEARINAAKKFIKFICDSQHTLDGVKIANFFPARNSAEGTDLSAMWADNATMNEYQVLMPYLGDYYNVIAGWVASRTAWWNTLQKIGNGEDVAASLAAGAAEANQAAAG